MKITSTLLLLILTVGYVQAETPKTADKKTEELQQYDIEIIIFEDAYARYLNSEVWPEEDLKDNLKNNPVADDEIQPLIEESEYDLEKIETLDQLTLDETNVTRFENIPPQILIEEYKKIDASNEQNVLLYASWRQAGLDETNAYEINIDELINNHELNKQAEAVLQNNPEENSIPKNNFTGHFKVVLARYLHFYSQLDYQRYQPAPDTVEDKSSGDGFSDETDQSGITSELIEKEIYLKQNFPMNNHRRMRSKELHYIDHPLVGMLIQINPSEIVPTEIEHSKKPEEVSPSLN